MLGLGHVLQLPIRLLNHIVSILLADLLPVFLLILINQLLFEALKFLMVCHNGSPFMYSNRLLNIRNEKVELFSFAKELFPVFSECLGSVK
ncbi:hypothetical protein D3C87_1565280 [compost metagenome]